MKKFIILLLFMAFIQGAALSQSCLPEGITFSTQEEIDNFQNNYPGCTEIEGEVTINGLDINNLSGLSVLTAVGGNLIIIKNDLLTSLAGLNALTTVGGYLEIGDVGDEGNLLLSSLNGLENLTSTGSGLTIRFNPSLTSFEGLNSLTSLGEGGFLLIQVNDALTDITALSNLTLVGGPLRVEYNASLTTLAGLENIIPGSVTDLFITANSLLTNCEVQSICAYLANPTGTVFIFNNAPGCEHPADIAVACGTTFDCLPYGFYHFYSQSYIDNFHIGFPECTVLNEYAVVSGDDITNLDGLGQITGVKGGLRIVYNPLLTNLNGLSNLTYVTDELWIQENAILTSLMGLDSLQADSIGDLMITDNPALSICDVQSICDYLDLPGAILTISNNAPGCNNLQQVEDACNGTGIAEVSGQRSAVSFYPNPFSDFITLEYELEQDATVNLSICNYLGQRVVMIVDGKQAAGRQQVRWNAEGMPAGIYFYRLTTDDYRLTTGKIVVVK
jgi:hypothetical protein